MCCCVEMAVTLSSLHERDCDAYNLPLKHRDDRPVFYKANFFSSFPSIYCCLIKMMLSPSSIISPLSRLILCPSASFHLCIYLRVTCGFAKKVQNSLVKRKSACLVCCDLIKTIVSFLCMSGRICADLYSPTTTPSLLPLYILFCYYYILRILQLSNPSRGSVSMQTLLPLDSCWKGLLFFENLLFGSVSPCLLSDPT